MFIFHNEFFLNYITNVNFIRGAAGIWISRCVADISRWNSL